MSNRPAIEAAMQLIELFSDWTLNYQATLPPDALDNPDVFLPSPSLTMVLMYAVCKLCLEEETEVTDAMNMLKPVIQQIDQGELLPHLLHYQEGGRLQDVLLSDWQGLEVDVLILQQLLRVVVELSRVGMKTRAQKLQTFIQVALEGAWKFVGSSAALQLTSEGPQETAEASKICAKVRTTALPALWCKVAKAWEVVKDVPVALTAENYDGSRLQLQVFCHEFALAANPDHTHSLGESARLMRTAIGAAPYLESELSDNRKQVQKLLQKHFEKLGAEFRAAYDGLAQPVVATTAANITGEQQAPSSTTRGTRNQSKKRGAKDFALTEERLPSISTPILPHTQSAASLPFDEEGDAMDVVDEGLGTSSSTMAHLNLPDWEDNEEGGSDIDNDSGSENSDAPVEDGDDRDVEVDALDGVSTVRIPLGGEGDNDEIATLQEAEDEEEAETAAQSALRWRDVKNSSQFSYEALKQEVSAAVECGFLSAAGARDSASASQFLSIALPFLLCWAYVPHLAEQNKAPELNSLLENSFRVVRKFRNRDSATTSVYQLASAAHSGQSVGSLLWNTEPVVSFNGSAKETVIPTPVLDAMRGSPLWWSVFQLLITIAASIPVGPFVGRDSLLDLAKQVQGLLETWTAGGDTASLIKTKEFGAELNRFAGLKSIEKFSYASGRQRTSKVKYAEYDDQGLGSVDDDDDAMDVSETLIGDDNAEGTGSGTSAQKRSGGKGSRTPSISTGGRSISVPKNGSSSSQQIIAWNRIRRGGEEPFVTAAGKLSPLCGALAKQLLTNSGSVTVANAFYAEALRVFDQERVARQGGNTGSAAGVASEIAAMPVRAGGLLNSSVEQSIPLGRLLQATTSAQQQGSSKPKSASAVVHMLAAHDFAMQRKHPQALEQYLAAYTADPNQPLTSLCAGAYLVMLANHKLTKQRHEILLKGIIFLQNYALVRRQGQGRAASSSTASSRAETQLTARAYEEGLYQETLYNLGRCFQELKLFHLAVDQYEKALALTERFPILKDDPRFVTRETAHNLVLIYRRSNATELALNVMLDYLTF